MNGAEKPEAGPDTRTRDDRLSRMSEASLRITESLELDAVLQGVVDGARTLTGAGHGGVTVLSDEGQSPVYVTSGLTSEQRQRRFELPGGADIFEHLSGLSEPLRIADLSGYASELGLPEISPPLGPVGAFLGMPIRHMGRRVGNFFLGNKEGAAEFTEEDEAMLVLFASQAALAIANARRYRDEQRTRAGLETLVNTSPVGVVVFDTGTGTASFVNREALRIVDGLRSPGQSPEELLEILTFRRADGREVSLKDYPMSRALSSGETVRAEEIAIEVPDGRRVNTIVNASPILSDEGDVASMVVTLQDMAPMREQSRQRAEFLDMVSQQLLAPLTSIKGSAAAVLEDLSRLDIAKARQFFSIIEWQADRMRGLIWDLLEVARIEAGTLALSPEPTDLASLIGQARAWFLEDGAENPVETDIPPDLPWVMADRQRALQVMDRLLSNAAGRSSDGSIITLSARRENSHVAVCVAERSREVPSQPQPLLFHRLSTAGSGGEGVTGGEALGLAVCQGIVESHGGRIWVENDGPGLGSRFIFTLPAAEEASPLTAGQAGLYSASGRRAPHGRGRVLVVDDDPQVLWHVRNSLTEAGYSPVATWDPEEVERLIAVERPHLVLLDSALAGADGSGLMQRISTMTGAPVVLLSDHGGTPERDLALAFESGADDYVARPFSTTELVTRVGAALRRRDAPGIEPHGGVFQLEELTVDYAKRRATVGGQPVALTDTEYRLLCEFAVNAGRILSREHLMNRVWATRDPGDSGVVRAYVKRLRRKLGETADNPRYIFNIPRVGYRLGAAKEQDGGS